MNRRSFLKRAAVAGASAPIVAATASGSAFAQAAKNWDDPTAWPDGNVPTANTVAQVTTSISLNHDVTVAGIDIAEGGELILDSASNVLIESSGNVVVYGILSMRPQSSVTHTLRFINVDEGRFVGGGMDVLASDVGLWIRHMGLLDAVGTPKVAWNRTGDDSTWSASDELIVTPVAKGDYTGFKAFTKGSAVPTVDNRFTAEVLNLTRNVKIEGTPGGRSHVNFHVERPQTVQYVELTHMGPRKPGVDAEPGGHVGRYPFHFHHGGDATRGSLVEGVVVHQSGNRAFVPHASHGITFRNCIAYDVELTAYWWDLPPESLNYSNNTNDGVWEGCVSAYIKGYGVFGFMLGAGENNVCRDSVAVGVQGGSGAAGFRWPDKGNKMQGVWDFHDNLAHNCKQNGMSVWQNTKAPHVVVRTTVYGCGAAGTDHGAYVNGYQYIDCLVYDCEHAIITRASGGEDRPLMFVGIEAENIRSAHVATKFHQLPGIGSQYIGGNLTSIEIDNDPGKNPDANAGLYDFVETGLTPSGVTILSAAKGTVVRIQHTNGTAEQVDEHGFVTAIATFYGDGAGGGGDSIPPTTEPPAPTTTTTKPQGTTTTTPTVPAPTTTLPGGPNVPPTTRPPRGGGRRKVRGGGSESRATLLSETLQSGQLGLPPHVSNASMEILRASRAAGGLGALDAPVALPIGPIAPSPVGGSPFSALAKPVPLLVVAGAAAATVAVIKRRMDPSVASIGSDTTRTLMDTVPKSLEDYDDRV